MGNTANIICRNCWIVFIIRKTISTVLAGTIGTGNIAGIASAIAVGGPGAIFWMWVISFISMATKMSEVALAVKYREKIADF